MLHNPQRLEGRYPRAARGNQQDGGEDGRVRRRADRLHQHEARGVND